MEKLKELYRVCVESGKIENGVVKTDLTRKVVAEKLGVSVATVNYLVKFITDHQLPQIEFAKGQRGKKKIDRESLINEIKVSLGIG